MGNWKHYLKRKDCIETMTNNFERYQREMKELDGEEASYQKNVACQKQLKEPGC